MTQTSATAAKDKQIFIWALNGILAALFITAFLVPQRFPAAAAGMVVVAALSEILALNRQLPLQNVLLAAVIIALFGGFAHGLCARTGIPFGPVIFIEDAGAKIFAVLPWTIPLLWLVAVFSSRGTARLILRPWRKTRTYGFWLIGLTAILAATFDFALEPFATHAEHFWVWQPTKIPVNWFGATPVNFLAWALVTLIILAFASPALIRKQPGGRTMPDFQPLRIWLGAILFFALDSGKAGLWPAVFADAAIGIIVTTLALLGGKW